MKKARNKNQSIKILKALNMLKNYNQDLLEIFNKNVEVDKTCFGGENRRK